MTNSIYQKGLGRLVAPDARDLNYPMRTLLAQEPLPAAQKKRYRIGPILDQGQTPHCVGFSWREWLYAAPIMTRTGPDADALYLEAQKYDEWAGTPHDGSSVRGGAKALDNLGHILEYRWATGLDDVVNWLLSGRGTIVCGTNWYTSMFDPDPQGIVSIAPNATIAGGHAYHSIGADRPKAMLEFQQSWGVSFGKKGHFFMTFETFDRLLKEQGEATSAVEKRVKR